MAGIPEPDVVAYGSLCLNGVPQTSADTAVVIWATVNVGGTDRVIGEYRMGDNDLAGNLYVLRIRRESGADGSAQGADAARAGQTVRVWVQVGNNTPLEAASFTLPEMGTIERRDLAVGSSLGIDDDSDNDLRDFAKFQRCFTAPGGSVSQECAAADLDGDNDVDPDDFRLLAESVPGPCSS